MKNIKSYSVLVALTVLGDSEADALESVFAAIDTSDLLEQDGIVGVEVMEDDVDELITDDDDDSFEEEED
jgi:hypothetical protein